MTATPVWNEKSLAPAIHDRQLAEHGGTGGVRDDKLLESTLARPQQLYAYGDPPSDLADLAASLPFGVARNHAFVDGNKRTAHVCYRTFLALNAVEFAANYEDKYVTMIALAEGKLSERESAAWLRRHIALAPRDQVNEKPPRYRHARKP
ncbi:MAG: type II toxin-antitoxin system death-on-curing family toxin [Rhodanobacteraceae bacterium]